MRILERTPTQSHSRHPQGMGQKARLGKPHPPRVIARLRGRGKRINRGDAETPRDDDDCRGAVGMEKRKITPQGFNSKARGRRLCGAPWETEPSQPKPQRGFHNVTATNNQTLWNPHWGTDDDERPMSQRALRDAGLWNVTPSAYKPLKFRGKRPHLESANRVALGGVPPRAPTDPYVRDYRIRFLSYDFATR